MKKKSNRKLIVTTLVLALVITVAGIGVGVSKAQNVSAIAGLVELANSLGGDSGVFSQAIAYLTGQSGQVDTSVPLGSFNNDGRTTAWNGGYFAEALEVDGTFTTNATTTRQEVTYGSRFFVALDFSAGNTTTPGAVGSLQNTGAPKVCTHVEIDISTPSNAGGALGEGGSLAFVVATSTNASTWSNDPAGLIASTTLPTSTVNVINNVDNVGTEGSDSWVWGNAEYLLVAFDDKLLSEGETEIATSSDIYTSMAGGFYVTCHDR